MSVVLAAVWLGVNSAATHNPSLEYWLQIGTLLLWPSSIFLLAVDGLGPHALAEVYLISVTANAILYAAVGVLVWFGLAKHPVALIVPVLAVAVLWRWLLSL